MSCLLHVADGAQAPHRSLEDENARLGLTEEGDIEEMPSELPMMTEEDFMMEDYDLDEDEDA